MTLAEIKELANPKAELIPIDKKIEQLQIQRNRIYENAKAQRDTLLFECIFNICYFLKMEVINVSFSHYRKYSIIEIQKNDSTINSLSLRKIIIKDFELSLLEIKENHKKFSVKIGLKKLIL